MGNHYKAQQFIDAIPDSAGIISTIARRVGCQWHTAKKYIDRYPTIKHAYNDECERVLDNAESVIINDIGAGEVGTAKWYLGMKGSDRGYRQKRGEDIIQQVSVEFNLDEWKSTRNKRKDEIEQLDAD